GRQIDERDFTAARRTATAITRLVGRATGTERAQLTEAVTEAMGALAREGGPGAAFARGERSFVEARVLATGAWFPTDDVDPRSWRGRRFPDREHGFDRFRHGREE